ncbi:MAG: SCO family protein [Chitinophagales bacterium]
MNYTSFRSFLLFLISLVCLGITSTACQDGQQDLKVLKKIEKPFQFLDQDSSLVSEKDMMGKIHVTDFFFTTCPTICPVMKTQMLRVYDTYKDADDFVLLSHTIDPKHDTVGVLKNYAEGLGIESDKWHLVTGDKDAIYEMAETYMVVAEEDERAPGGFIHSGAFMLLDKNRQIRGIFDGTKEEEVDQLIKAIKQLQNEK